MTTDKQDTITRKKMKLQRMILTDTVLNLHKEFTKKEPRVKLSYSSFCALRPSMSQHQDRQIVRQANVSTMKMLS